MERRFSSKSMKEVLIKDVAQAIPSYIMSCHKIPVGVCKDIERLLARFWWGAKNGDRKLHWLSWENLVKAKELGDLGFRGIEEFNLSLLGKHFWRLQQQDKSLFWKVSKRRYFPNCSIQEACARFNPSYVWRSMIGARDMVMRG